MVRSVTTGETLALSPAASRKTHQVLLAIADDDLCLWFWQDVTRAGARPIVVSSATEARAKMASESNICLLIAMASESKASKALFREARARNIPYAIARSCGEGLRLSHMNGNMFEGAPSAMGEYLFNLVQSTRLNNPTCPDLRS